MKIQARAGFLTSVTAIFASMAIPAEAQLPNPPASAAQETATSSSPALEEVVVTAQKRGEERLQDTPIPISVLSPDSLTENAQVLLRDYYASVPGLSVTPDIEAQQEVSIRGIAQQGGNPTVAVLIDDIPYGGSSSFSGNYVPDIDPGDLARIEVLRGPQGTLYGANSMGGVIRYVTKDPSTEGFSGRIDAGTSDVYNGAEPGYNLRASANIPLGDTLAMRASAFTRQDPGYIDNVVQNIRGINEAEAFGARLVALWQPTDVFSLKLSALYQKTRGNGVPEINKAVNGYGTPPPSMGGPPAPPLGDLQQAYVAGVDRYDVSNQAYAAVVKIKLGVVDLTSDTGYSINHVIDPFDFSFLFGSIFQSLYGVSGAPLISDQVVDKISQELRLSGTIGQNFDWLIGGYYTHENTPRSFEENIYEDNATTGQIVGDFLHQTQRDTFEEYAAFGDLTYHFTDRLDVQIGARESHDNEVFHQVTTGPFVNAIYGLTPPLLLGGSATGNAFTYLLTPQFKVSPDFMVYARLASGYRPGGPNPVPVTGIPSAFSPDKTYNYELGAKGNFLDHRLSVDASVYYIDWRNIQLTLINIYSYGANGSGAKSEGIELTASGKPVTGLTISGWIDYENAVLTAAFPAASTAVGLPGEKLPFAPQFSARLSIDQEFRLTNHLDGFAGAAASFVGTRQGLFVQTPERENYPAYTRTDLRAGLKYDTWTTSLYANNVGNVHGIISGGLGYYNPTAFNVIQPRTVGLSVVKTF